MHASVHISICNYIHTWKIGGFVRTHMSALKVRFPSYSAVVNMVLLGILGSVRPACSVYDPETYMLLVVIGRPGIGIVVFTTLSYMVPW